MKCIAPGLDVSIGNSVGSDCRFGTALQLKSDSGKLYYVSTEGYNSYINTIDEAGSIERITLHST
jgi:hypothetical protein